MDLVDCYSCGFFAKYCPESTVPPPRFFEVTEAQRMQGDFFYQAIESGHVPRHSYPTCYRRVPEALKEFLPFTDLVLRDATRALQIIHKPRTCQEWCEYVPAFSPKEHLEEVRVQALEIKRQEFEEKMVKDHKEFMAKLDASNKCFQLKVTCVLGFIAVVEIIVTALQLLYPTGLPWLQSIPRMPGF